MKVCSERNVYGYIFELIIPIVTFFLCIVCTFKFWSDFDIYEKIKTHSWLFWKKKMQRNVQRVEEG
jgi:hypothetical protein